ncbi:MAG: SMC-Scp complex subunit ScpB [Proteobacteria bacterium]|nr:SMC-Scp complex subunit ScpB [Pseudomonadota bacterium]
MTETHIRNVIEAALLAAGKPLHPAELVELFDEGAARPTMTVVQATLAALAEEYSTRGIELKETAAGFRIQVRPVMSNEISRLWPERPPKYSRALLETLAIIAYRQPITRAEIESVRGVAVNPNIVKTVIERNWVHVVGHRDVPGRPELLGTTRDFLDYFGLKRLDELPPLAEIKAIGEIKVQFDLPDPGLMPADDAATGGASAAEAASAERGAPAVGSESNNTASGEAIADGAEFGEAVAGEHAAPDADVSLAATQKDTPSEDAVAQTTSQHAVDADASTESETSDAGAAAAESEGASKDDAPAGDQEVAHASSEGNAPTAETPAAPKSTSRGSGRKNKRGKARATSDTALHEAEEFVASVDADLAGDDESSDEDELSAAGPDASELVAGPRDIDD